MYYPVSVLLMRKTVKKMSRRTCLKKFKWTLIQNQSNILSSDPETQFSADPDPQACS
jgi:hypothetical protein